MTGHVHIVGQYPDGGRKVYRRVATEQGAVRAIYRLALQYASISGWWAIICENECTSPHLSAMENVTNDVLYISTAR